MPKKNASASKARPKRPPVRGARRAVKSRLNYTSPERIAKIYEALDELFPEAHCALRHENPFQLLVATILSAQCTDERVNKVTPGLFAKYPTPQDFAALQPEVLQEDIRSTG